jgi:hypothetical protein
MFQGAGDASASGVPISSCREEKRRMNRFHQLLRGSLGAGAAHSGRHAVLAVCLSLAGVVTLTPHHHHGPGVEALGVIWNTMSSAQQQSVCTSIRKDGVKAVARKMARQRKGIASVKDTEYFLKGLACHIRVYISTG